MGQALKGRIAVVTGSSRGIGRGTAIALGEEGATVYVTGRTSGAGELTVEAFGKWLRYEVVPENRTGG